MTLLEFVIPTFFFQCHSHVSGNLLPFTSLFFDSRLHGNDIICFCHSHGSGNPFPFTSLSLVSRLHGNDRNESCHPIFFHCHSHGSGNPLPLIRLFLVSRLHGNDKKRRRGNDNVGACHSHIFSSCHSHASGNPLPFTRFLKGYYLRCYSVNHSWKRDSLAYMGCSCYPFYSSLNTESKPAMRHTTVFSQV